MTARDKSGKNGRGEPHSTGVTLFRCAGGTVELPDRALVLVDRQDGGNLIVLPPRPVWDRSELDATELSHWSFLIAATARAMLDTLPQLAGGCINYWDAGNWRLNHAAAPVGPKNGPAHRQVHMHLLGRSRTSTDPSWEWGEAPVFPRYAGRFAWAKGRVPLDPEECATVAVRAQELLLERYGMTS